MSTIGKIVIWIDCALLLGIVVMLIWLHGGHDLMRKGKGK